MAYPISPHSIFFLTLFLLSTASHGREILVGGSSINSWKFPSSSSAQNLSQWAESTRFQVGDSLVWNFDGEKDSVVEVSRDDYYACRTWNPIAVHHGGDNRVGLVRSGAYYFVGGAAGACEKGERVVVVVISQKHVRRVGFLAPAPAPASLEIDEGPAVAPAMTPGIAGAASEGLFGVGVAAAALVLVGMIV
ncbi:Early nodulin-like protein 1 [Platanthera guangdongensis]|uniref:Early nodulin-like protein 1 n=1 Tax=Platanthera guangdongensis TaxID=2320717 RepID=A0ABR2MRF1_9ASPA